MLQEQSQNFQGMGLAQEPFLDLAIPNQDGQSNQQSVRSSRSKQSNESQSIQRSAAIEPIRRDKRTRQRNNNPRSKLGEGEQNILPKIGRKTDFPLFRSHILISRTYDLIIANLCKLRRLIAIQFHNLPSIIFPPADDQLSRYSRLMQEDNFPLTPKGEIFQLPPNSPHYLFEQLKEKTYTATEILNFMKIYFSANGLLSQEFLKYMQDYWKSIIFLAIHPDPPKEPRNHDLKDEQHYVQVLQSSPRHRGRPQTRPKNPVKKPSNSERVRTPTLSQTKAFQAELKEDHSLIAYYLAAYICSCREKYKFVITS